MYIYLFFIILGILFFVLLNNHNTFSIGIPTYTIQSLTPNTPFLPGQDTDQIFTAHYYVPRNNAINQQGQTLQEYIESHDDIDFPGGFTNYVLVPIDSPEVDEGELVLDPRSNEYYKQRLRSLGISDENIDKLIEITSSQKKILSLACATLPNDQSLFTTFIRDSELYQSISQHIDRSNISLMDLINILENTKVFYQTLSREHNISLDNIYDIFIRLIVLLIMNGYNVEQIIEFITNLNDSTFLDDYLDNYNSDNNIIIQELYNKFLEDNS